MFNMCEFHENRRREGRTVLMAVNGSTSMGVPCACMTLGEVQENSVKAACFVRHGVHLLQFCDAESSFGLDSVLNAI
jgi:hypothetical protein